MLTRVSLSCLISSTRENLECKYYAEDSLIYKENNVETPSIQSSSKVRRDALQFLVILTCLYKNMVNYRELETLETEWTKYGAIFKKCDLYAETFNRSVMVF